MAKQSSKSIDEARCDPVFWERLFMKQMEMDVADVVREVVFATSKNPAEIYKERAHLALPGGQAINQHLKALVQNQLQKEVERWGAKITTLEIDKFEVDSNRFSSDSPVQKEAKRVELIRNTEAKAEAARVKRLVETLRDSGVQLSEKMIADIVISAIQASHDWGLDNDYDPLLVDTAPASKAGDAKKSAKS